MAENKVKVVKAEPKVNKRLIFTIGFLVVVVLILIIIKFFEPSLYFYLLIFCVAIGIAIFTLNKNKKENYFDIIRKVQVETFKNLPGSELNTSAGNVQCIEVSPNNFIVHFLDINRAYEYKDGIITGMQIRSLYNIKQDREKLSYLREIAKFVNEKNIITAEAGKVGLEIPEED